MTSRRCLKCDGAILCLTVEFPDAWPSWIRAWPTEVFDMVRRKASFPLDEAAERLHKAVSGSLTELHIVAAKCNHRLFDQVWPLFLLHAWLPLKVLELLYDTEIASWSASLCCVVSCSCCKADSKDGAGSKKEAMQPVKDILLSVLQEFPSAIITKNSIISAMQMVDAGASFCLSGKNDLPGQLRWAQNEGQALKLMLQHLKTIAGNSKDFSRQPAFLLPLLQKVSAGQLVAVAPAAIQDEAPQLPLEDTPPRSHLKKLGPFLMRSSSPKASQPSGEVVGFEGAQTDSKVRVGRDFVRRAQTVFMCDLREDELLDTALGRHPSLSQDQDPASSSSKATKASFKDLWDPVLKTGVRIWADGRTERATKLVDQGGVLVAHFVAEPVFCTQVPSAVLTPPEPCLTLKRPAAAKSKGQSCKKRQVEEERSSEAEGSESSEVEDKEAVSEKRAKVPVQGQKGKKGQSASEKKVKVPVQGQKDKVGKSASEKKAKAPVPSASVKKPRELKYMDLKFSKTQVGGRTTAGPNAPISSYVQGRLEDGRWGLLVEIYERESPDHRAMCEHISTQVVEQQLSKGEARALKQRLLLEGLP
jgi:hypothetical protein